MFFSRFLCHKTCYDVLITIHDVSYESIVKYRNNYDLKIANGQLVDFFFFSKILLIFSLFSFFLPFSSFFHSPPTLTLLCLSAMNEVTPYVISPAALGVGAPPGKNGENFSFNRRFLPILHISRSSVAHYYTAN